MSLKMKNKIKYICSIISIAFLSASDFTPENNQTLNYTQVFFSWPQISNQELYTFIISEAQDFFDSDTTVINSNSILYEDLLDWGTTYHWKICGQNDNENCLPSKSFTINSIPSYHADQITINHLNQEQYTDGINILDFESIGYSLALDMYGEPLWFSEKDNFHMNNITVTQFLDNGNLIGYSNGRGYEFTLDSHIVFETPVEYGIHHQISKTDSDTYFFIDAYVEYHDCPLECDDSFSYFPIPWQGDRYIEIDSNGVLIWEWNTFDNISLDEYNPLYAETYNGVNELDWTHSNSLVYDDQSGSVYVSIRNLSRIASIDYATGNINWNLGESDYMENPSFENEINFSQQHSAQLTPAGDLIFFDNARFQDPEHSRCVEVGFQENEPYLIWEHVLPDSMFTGSRGECDRLSSGNSLISAGRTGNVIEVNSENEIVWHLTVDNSGNDVSIYRTERIMNLFPNIFSFKVDDALGDYSGYTVSNDGSLEITIYNHGWGIDGFEYFLFNEWNEVIINGFINDSSDIIEFSLDLSDYNIYNDSYYSISINPINNQTNFSQVGFYFHEVIIGDVNVDGNVDVLDVVQIVNFIIGNSIPDEAQACASDINEDGNVDVLDVVQMVSMIIN